MLPITRTHTGNGCPLGWEDQPVHGAGLQGQGVTAEIGHLTARLLAISHGAGKYSPPTAFTLPRKPSGADGFIGRG
ncbi:MAG: hypothetical protein ACYDHZ_07005 [Dehalococcoidia bacterium]